MKTHRECYPEQYAHPMVGRIVEIVSNGTAVARGTVERVFGTRFGPLVTLVGCGSETAWRLADCHTIDD